MKPQRRRPLLLAALAVIVLALAWPMWNGFNQNYNRARVQANQAELRLQQALSLRERILADRAASQSLERYVRSRGINFDLYSYVNERVQRHGAQESVKLTSKGTSTSGRAMQAVSLEFRGTHIRTLLNLIQSIYDGKNLIVMDRLHHMRPARNGFGIDCEITFVSPQS